MSSRSARRVALVLALSLCSLSGVLSAEEEKVAFNTESKKYHCLTCQWAKKCTRNCVVVALSEAKRRGGVPCKVCSGSCAARSSAAPHDHEPIRRAA